jgi:uridine kinase
MESDSIIQKLLSEKEHPVVFVCGFSGSGKTTTALHIAATYPNTKILHLDWYITYITKVRRVLMEEKKIPEDPQTWYDWDVFLSHIVELQKNGSVALPGAWDQKTNSKTLEVHLNFEGQSGLILCDGIYLLHPEIKALADVVILKALNFEESNRRANLRDSYKNDTDYFAYKVALREKYDKPYFDEHRLNADIIL